MKMSARIRDVDESRARKTRKGNTQNLVAYFNKSDVQSDLW